jgi:hypothetical protein
MSFIFLRPTLKNLEPKPYSFRLLYSEMMEMHEHTAVANDQALGNAPAAERTAVVNRFATL